MLVKDREKLARIMEIQGVGVRQLCRAIGWRSHSYMSGILSGRVRTVTPIAAMKIACYLRHDVYDFFTPKMTIENSHNEHERVSA